MSAPLGPLGAPEWQVSGARLTGDDLLRAAKLNHLAGMLGRRTLAVVTGLGVVGFVIVFIIAEGERHRFLIAIAGTLAAILYLYGLMLVARYVALPLAVRRQVREQKSLAGTLDIAWDDRRLVVSADGIRSETAWSSYHRWREDERFILLYLSSRLYQVLPKRWLSIRQIDEIHAALAQAGVARAPLVFG